MRTTTLRWDCMFVEGIKILHRFACALFSIREKEILAMAEFEELIVFLTSPAFTDGISIHDLVTAAFG